ncbi:hypothetical protein GGX14DRAFT_693073 [Mycena pura]|uniref:F-box domain-containing protein n=1 Tax=Mycena pura TaxID=153505 RepID=A0AAD6YQZ8_9AGAR|nr:hypothetical protein GGX14DRAFT_693073 [Mycena pura]
MHIDELAPEILLEIFEWAKASPPFAVGGSAIIISISQVCRKWRDITCDSTLLWDDVRLTSGSSQFKLEQLLARSSGSPLSISIDYRATNAALWYHRRMLEVIVVHRRRIRALHVIAPLHILSLLSREVFCLGADFPLLCRLHVTQEFLPSRKPDERTVDKVPCCRWTSSWHAPQLRSLSVSAITPTTCGIPGRLKELHVQDSGYFVQSVACASDGNLETAISHFLNLEVLSITSSPLPSLARCRPIDTQIVSLTLAHLRTADIPPGTLARFLFTLRMPSLRHLSLNSLSGYLWEELVGWLSNAALRSVAFESLAPTAVDEQCLRALPSISELRLVDVDPQPILCILASNPNICPALREIDVGKTGTRIGRRR